MKTYWRLLSYTKPFTRYALPFFITSLLASIFGILNIALLIPTLNVLFDVNPSNVPSAPTWEMNVDAIIGNFYYYMHHASPNQGKIGQLYFVCLIIFISVLFSNIFRYLNSRILVKLKARTVYKIRKETFENAVDLHLQYFTNERKGNIMSRLTTDLSQVESSVIQSFSSVLKDPFTLIISFIALFTISLKMTFFAFIFIPLSGGLVAFIVGRLKKVSKESQSTLATMISMLDETFGGIRVIKAFNASNYVKDRYDQKSQDYQSQLLKAGFRRELSSPTSEFLGVCIIVGAVLYGGSLILSGESDLQAGEFFGFIGILSRVTEPIKSITKTISQLQRGIVSADRIFELVDQKSTITDKTDAHQIQDFSQEITFENVSFSYDGQKDVLHDLNFTLQKGKMIALVGESGGGKSTIADLVPRFYDPTKGAIKIDGHDLRDCKLESIRAQMGIVTQESILFNDTIFNNIAFGKESTHEDVIEAAKIANAHDFIMKLPQQYQTSIGDRGNKLSGGQKQRISIARAVLQNPPIMILDEATSALDTASEKLVQEALNKLMQHRTSLVIAHRLSTIQSADEILVIKEGRIIERGPHEDLIQKPQGVYARLSQAQSIIT